MTERPLRPQPPPPPPADQAPSTSLTQAFPGVARLAITAWWHTAEWTVGTSLSVSSRMLRAAASGQPPTEFLQDAGNEVRGFARRLLGLANGEPSGGDPSGAREHDRETTARDNGAGPGRSLRERGEELLRQSADVRYEEAAHPAYGRILGEMAPDEGRVLRFLALSGPQAAVDVRAAKALNVGSALVAPGLSMIGPQAGCRYVDRIPAYLNNLERLGLVWFSREALEDPLRYQVLEAQPDVLQAMRTAGRSRLVRRSIHLTPFGDDFCRVCLPLGTAELDALPGVAIPEEELPASLRRPGPTPRTQT